MNRSSVSALPGTIVSFTGDPFLIDPAKAFVHAFREARSHSLQETLFVLMTLGDDRAVRATYVAGALAHASDPVDA